MSASKPSLPRVVVQTARNLLQRMPMDVLRQGLSGTLVRYHELALKEAHVDRRVFGHIGSHQRIPLPFHIERYLGSPGSVEPPRKL